MPEYKTVTDYEGRKLEIRTLSPSEQFQLMIAIGPQASAGYLTANAARRAARVASIDGQAIPIPSNEKFMMSHLDRVGEAGQDAVASIEEEESAVIDAKKAAVKAAAKNSEAPPTS